MLGTLCYTVMRVGSGPNTQIVRGPLLNRRTIPFIDDKILFGNKPAALERTVMRLHRSLVKHSMDVNCNKSQFFTRCGLVKSSNMSTQHYSYQQRR
jgi:hypothetical protein